MSIGTHRLFRYRLPYPGEGEPLPEEGDFVVSVTSKPEDRWSTYRVVKAELRTDVVEPWCAGGHDDAALPEGTVCRVLHYRIACVRVPPDERPRDAMTWRMLADKRGHRH